MRLNAGKASGAVRRRKKQLRQLMQDLLAKDVMDAKQLRKVANMGYDEVKDVALPAYGFMWCKRM